MSATPGNNASALHRANSMPNPRRTETKINVVDCKRIIGSVRTKPIPAHTSTGAAKRVIFSRASISYPCNFASDRLACVISAGNLLFPGTRNRPQPATSGSGHRANALLFHAMVSVSRLGPPSTADTGHPSPRSPGRKSAGIRASRPASAETRQSARCRYTARASGSGSAASWSSG